MPPAELEAMTLAEVQAHELAWLDREKRLEDRAARTALFTAVKVWDSENKVDVIGLFPILGRDRADELSPEEASRREWTKLRGIFAMCPPTKDGGKPYAIHRDDPG